MSRSWSEHDQKKLSAEIAELQSLDVAQLKARWRSLYATEPPSRFSRDLLIRAVDSRHRADHCRHQYCRNLASITIYRC
jgi:hypothetical protein